MRGLAGWTLGALAACAGAPVDDPGEDASEDTDPVGTSDVGVPEGFVVRMEATPTDFWGQPWPSDARRKADGHLDLAGFPLREENASRFVAAVEELVVGHSVTPAVFFGLSEPIDPGSLPTPEASEHPGASLSLRPLVDGVCGEPVRLVVEAVPLDPYVASPVVRARVPADRPLRPGTVHVLVVRPGIVSSEGAPMARSRAVTDALAEGTGPAAAGIEALRSCVGEDLDDVLAFTVFTTHDAPAELRRLAEAVAGLDLPSVEPLSWVGQDHLTHDRYETTVRVPIFQEGTSPYTTEGGAIRGLDTAVPAPVGWEDVPLRVALPNTDDLDDRPVFAMQGTGAGAWSFSAAPPVVGLVHEGRTAISFPAQFHAGREVESNTALGTYNIANPWSIRNTMRQQAVETLWMLRIVQEALADDPVLAHLDLATWDYYGHSQGTQAGAMLPLVAPEIERYAFNGIASSIENTALNRKDPLDFRLIAEGVAGTPLDAGHPFLQLLTLVGEPADPGAYVRGWTEDPARTGGVDVLVINGEADPTTSPDGMSAVAAGGGLVLVRRAADGLPAFASPISPEQVLPITGTHTVDGVERTLVAWHDPEGGHHAVVHQAAAREALETFFASPSGDAATVDVP